MERKNKFGKISPEKAKEIQNDRELGMSYNNISTKHNISKWWCIQHLRHIKPTRNWLEEKWKAAEKEAKTLLEKKGYTHIVNLNDICPSPYWDYYAEKDEKRWLFDVTINQHKNLVEKGLHAIEGYSIAVLLKEEEGWKLLEIKVKEI